MYYRGYNVHRCDRPTYSHAGLLVAIRHELNMAEIAIYQDIQLVSGTTQKITLTAYYQLPPLYKNPRS